MAQAETDLKLALAGGVESAALYFNLALAQLACKEQGEAVDSLRRALKMNPQHEEARATLRSLSGE